MKFVIEKRHSFGTLLEGEAESFKEFVVKNKSNLSDSDLSESDLSNSDLSGSDLRASNLSDSNLSRIKIKANQKEELLLALRIKVKE